MTLTINGKEYPLWSQFVEGKEKFIDGVLEDFGDSIDIAMGYKGGTTIIKDIMLEPNGDDSAMFNVIGEDFSCGFNVQHGGITDGEKGWITFSGYGGYKWRIKSVIDKREQGVEESA